MSAKDRPVSKPSNDKYRENYDRIFGAKNSENKTKAETVKNQRGKDVPDKRRT